MRWIAVACALAGCGRIGFGGAAARGGDGGSDGGGAADAVDAIAPDASLCAAAVQLPLDEAGTPVGSWIGGLSVVPDGAGMAVFYVAPDSHLFTAAFAPIGGVMHQRIADIDFATGVLRAAPVALPDDHLAFVADWGSGGTGFDELSTELALTGSGAATSRPVTHPFALAGDGSILGYLGNADGSAVPEQIDGKTVMFDGSTQGSSPAAIGAAELPLSATIDTGPDGFVVTWVSQATSPAVIRAQLLHSDFTPSVATTTISDGARNAYQPSAAWASGPQALLFAWAQANDEDTQDIWIARADATLTGAIEPTRISAKGTVPKLASDGTSFLLAVGDFTSPSGLSAAIVDASGNATVRDVIGNGGQMVDYAVTALADGLHLVWAERMPGGNDSTTVLWDVPAASCAL